MSVTEPDSLGFALLPPDPGLINPDLQLDAALSPVEDDQPDVPQPFGRSWRFDFVAGQFVKNGLAPQVTYELDSLIVWVEKTLRTDRYAHPIYSDEYGIEGPFDIVGQQADEELLAAYQDAISTALLVHDRIVSVEDFSFTQDPFEEELYGSFTVIVDAAPPLEAQPVEFSDIPLT